MVVLVAKLIPRLRRVHAPERLAQMGLRDHAQRPEACGVNTVATIKSMTQAKTRPLNDGQLLFIDEYMKDRNAMQAYIRAGYSVKAAKTQAYRLLENPGVKAEIGRRVEEYSKTAGITMVRILEEQRRIAFMDLAACFDPETGALLPIHKIPEDTRRALASIKVVEQAGGMAVEKDGQTGHVPMYDKEVKAWDKPAALKTLMEYFKMLPPPEAAKTDVYVNVDMRGVMEEARALLRQTCPKP